MSELSVFPLVNSAARLKDSQPEISGNRQAGSGESNFEKYLERASLATEKLKTAKPEQAQEKPADQSHPVKTDSPKEAGPKTVTDGKKAETSSETKNATAVDAKKKGEPGAEKEQPETGPANTNADQILSLLTDLEAEAEIRAETQPDTVQATELSEVMANSDLTASMLQAASQETGPAEPVLVTPVTTADDLSAQQVQAETVVVAENLNQKPEATLEVKAEVETVDLGEFNQVLNQVAVKMPQTEGESFSKKDQDSNTEGREPNPKVVQLASPAAGTNQNQISGRTAFPKESILPKVTTDQPAEQERALTPEQVVAKNGKVNLAVIQTHLAVSEAPKLKTDMPVLNIMPGQPVAGNGVQLLEPVATTTGPVTKEELFSQIVEHAKVVVNNGGSEMEVNLKPDNLGKLQLKVAVENQVVTARFVAESQQVKEIIESNLGQLRRNLQENGMQVDVIMVSVGQHQGGESFEQAAFGRDDFNHFTGSTKPEISETVADSEDETPAPRTIRETVIDLIA